MTNTHNNPIVEEKRTLNVQLSEEEVVSLGNLSVTLHENLEGLRTLVDCVNGTGHDERVGEFIEDFLPALDTIVLQTFEQFYQK